MSEFEAPISRIEAILQNILGADNEILPPFSRNEVLLIQIAGLLSGIKTDVTNKQDSILGGTKWKLIKGVEIAESSTATRVDLGEGFFANPKYTRFKIELKLKTSESFTATGIPIRAYFQISAGSGYSLGYRIITTAAQSVFRPSGDSNFETEILIDRISDNGIITTILPSNNVNGSGNAIYASRNNGNFENSATPETLRYLYLDAMATSGFTMEEGSIINFYAWEE